MKILPNKNKVCILTSVHSTFDTRIFHKEAMSLVNNGYDVTLITQYDKNETVNGVNIVPLPKVENRIGRIFGLTLKTFSLSLKQKADVYHFHDPELIPVCLALKTFGKKVVYDVHEHYPNSILDKYWIPKNLRHAASKLFDIFEKVFVPFFDYVIYTTPIVGERYKRLQVKVERIENYPLLELSENFASNPQKNIIYLGGMSKIRGITELIEAFGMVVKNHPIWELRLVGKAAPQSFAIEIQELIIKLNLEKNVKLIPWVPYEEKERLSSQAYMGVVTYLPYANNTSCLPNKLFDYMLVGLPVVASNFPLYKEIIDRDKSGLIVNPSNPEEIAKAIEYLIEHPDEAKKMGNNGKKSVLEKYNWTNEERKLLAIYKELDDKN